MPRSRFMRKAAILAATAMSASLALAGCTTTGGGAAGGQQTYDKSNIVLVASVINTTNPYMASMIQGAQALSKKLKVPLEIVDSQGSSQTEISKIQAIIAKGKKVALMVNTVASSDAPTIVNAVKASGGYVTVWWNKPDNLHPWDSGDNFVAFMKYPGVSSGACNADTLGAALKGKGGVIMLPGVQDSTTSQTRVAGFKAELKAKYPGVKVLEEVPSDWDPAKANANVKTMIAKYGNQINGVWAADDAMMLGAIDAFKAKNLQNNVKFTSDGLYPPTIEYMKSGFGNDAIVGETFHRGYMAAAMGLYAAYQAATGELKVKDLTKEQREPLFKLSCVTPDKLSDYTKYDSDIPGWIDQMMKSGVWKTDPTPVVGQGPEKIPAG